MVLEKSLSFLHQLRRNNNRDWMQQNKPLYLEAKEEFIDFTKQVLSELSVYDNGLSDLEAKACIFRINRDIRFSKDKSPYKNNFGAFMVEGGKKSGNAGYYFHLEPGNNSFIGGGVYAPSSENLSSIRQEIDYNPSELKTIVDDATFVEYFGAIKGDMLKRAPKGYSEDHPNIELLKLKSYVVMKNVEDSIVADSEFLKKAVSAFKVMQPFNEYLNVAMS